MIWLDSPAWISSAGVLPYLQEVGILKGLNYDRNVIQFYGACLQPGRDPMLVCEYMEGGHWKPLHVCHDCHPLPWRRLPVWTPFLSVAKDPDVWTLWFDS